MGSPDVVLTVPYSLVTLQHPFRIRIVNTLRPSSR